MINHLARVAMAAVTLAACAAAPQASAPGPTETATTSFPPTATPTATLPATTAPTAAATATVGTIDPATVDACTLIDAATIGAVLSESVTAGVARDTEERAICFYDVPTWPVPIGIPEDSGVSISVWREEKTVSTAEVYAAGADQQVVTEVDGLGDAAWWTVHEELPNVHINTENAALDVVAEPLQIRIAFIQIPNPVGIDKGEWLADATELAEQVLSALGG